MAWLAKRPKTEEDALTLTRRIVWYLAGKRVKLSTPQNWEHAAYSSESFIVTGARPYFVMGGPNKGWWIRVSTSYVDASKFVDIKKYNDLELI